jgi:hypothetical protein
MAETKPKSPEEVLSQLLQNGNTVDPYASVDATPYTPQYGQTPQQQAQDTVSLQYDSQQRAVEEAARQAATENQYQRNVEQSYGKIIDPRLENIYGALGNTLTQGRAETQGNYQSAIDKIRSYYDEALGAGQRVNTDLLNRLTQSAGQLGLGAAIPEATAGLSSDYQFNQGQLTAGKAGRSANLGTLAAQIFGLDTGRIGAAAQEGAQARAGAQSEVLATLGELLRAGQKEQSGYRSQLSGLKSDRAIDLRKTIGDITSQRSKEGIEGRKSAIEEFLARSGLAQQNFSNQASLAGGMRDRDIQQQQFAESIRQQGLDRAAANARSAASRSRSSGAGGMDLKDIASIANMASQIEARGKGKLSGMEALNKFLNTDSKYWVQASKHPGVTAPVAGPKFRAAIQDIMARAAKNAPAKRDSFGTKVRDTRKEYDVAKKLAASKDYRNMNQDALRSALEAYYEGVPTQASGGIDLNALLMLALGG